MTVQKDCKKHEFALKMTVKMTGITQKMTTVIVMMTTQKTAIIEKNVISENTDHDQSYSEDDCMKITSTKVTIVIMKMTTAKTTIYSQDDDDYGEGNCNN